jgi:VacB/RNase II family 3'-5' exoribonuclease
MNHGEQQHRAILQDIARKAMLERGLLPDFSPAVLAELDEIRASTAVNGGSARDLRDLPWASIDNDDSRDLDQLTVAETMSGDGVKVRVAVADVDGLVKDRTAIDGHARHNTTSVYTAARVFPMLPEDLSTGLTSLNPGEERVSMVVEMVVGEDGSVRDADVYRASVRNHAKLAYNSVAAWLEGNEAMPEAVTSVAGLAENLRMQDRVAQSLRGFRHLHGALSLETIEARPVFEGDAIRDLRTDERNRAKDIIEDFMIAANGVTARYLSSRGLPSIRRVVRTPKRWDRIVELASERAFVLPGAPDPRALEAFLAQAKAADPLRFPDLSLAVIKLLGAGEYVAEGPAGVAPGHFGLAVKDYTHSTAPNRRYTDLITQRLLKAATEGRPSPYSTGELDALATRCTQAEDLANKVERQVAKSAAALLLESRIGEQFDAIVTGAADKGTWVRLLGLPVEGRLARGFEGLDVGHRVRVQLVSVDVWQGYIDFRRVGQGTSRQR